MKTAYTLLLVLVFCASAFAASNYFGDYFPLHPGDSWKYHWTFANRSDDYTMNVINTEIQPDHTLQYLVETATSTQSFQEWYSKPQGFVEVHKTLYPRNKINGEYTPVKIYLKNPLRMGDSWTWKGTGIMGVKIEESNKVIANETVTVPAGKFIAMKVETDLIQNGARVKKLNWFAKGVGLVKSVTQSNGMESTSVLLEYSAAGSRTKR